MATLPIKLLKFAIIGVINGIIYGVSVSFFISEYAFDGKVASLLGYCTAVPFAFFAHHYYTFESKGKFRGEWLRFVITQSTGMLVSILAMAAVMDYFKLNYLVGIVAGVILVPIVNFLALNFWVFPKNPLVKAKSKYSNLNREDVMIIRDVLKFPLVYQTYQNMGGFFGARLKAIKYYLPIKSGDKIVDIGCGPGFIIRHLPNDISYIGFDTDESYISYAKARFGHMGQFFCHLFDEPTALNHFPVDIVMMNGVLHHLSDDEVHQTLDVIKHALASGGRLFTLDGCYIDGQPALARLLLKYDRGLHVRTPEHYKSLMAAHFEQVEVHIDETLSWVPYTWITMVGKN
jgi:putative flippase GtrA